MRARHKLVGDGVEEGAEGRLDLPPPRQVAGAATQRVIAETEHCGVHIPPATKCSIKMLDPPPPRQVDRVLCVRVVFQ